MDWIFFSLSLLIIVFVRKINLVSFKNWKKKILIDIKERRIKMDKVPCNLGKDAME